MRIVITGGAGFLGSSLCDCFIDKDFEVICADNLITGDFNNIKHLIKNPLFTFLEHNITEHLKIDSSIDYVLHFASPASPADYLKYPIQTLKVGALGTLNMLGLAKEKKSRFLLASTSEVYGDPLVSPQSEDYWGNVNPIGPRGVYDEAKRYAEAMTMAYHRYHGINTSIARIFNTYGPRMRKNDGRAIPQFINQALEGKPLTVFGDGSQTRSFCYVSDMIDGLYRLVISNIVEPVNIGNPKEFTLLDLAKKIKTLVNPGSQIVFEELPEDDPKQRKPDINKAKQLLGWQPKISLDDGLKKTIEWYRKNY